MSANWRVEYKAQAQLTCVLYTKYILQFYYVLMLVLSLADNTNLISQLSPKF